MFVDSLFFHWKSRANNLRQIECVLSFRFFSISILRIETVCAEFYLQDRTHFILRIEILLYALHNWTTQQICWEIHNYPFVDYKQYTSDNVNNYWIAFFSNFLQNCLSSTYKTLSTTVFATTHTTFVMKIICVDP